MTEDQRTQLRSMILLQLDAAHPTPLGLHLVQAGVKLAGFALELPVLQSELATLVECGHARIAHSPLNLANKNYTRTEAGRVALVEAGLLA